MATICRKILRYIIVSAPKPVVNIAMQAFETGIFVVFASSWQILAYQSLVLLAKQSKTQLQVGEYVLTSTVRDYLIIVVNILAITMFPEVLQMRGGARAYSYTPIECTCILHKCSTMLHTYADRGMQHVLDS